MDSSGQSPRVPILFAVSLVAVVVTVLLVVNVVVAAPTAAFDTGIPSSPPSTTINNNLMRYGRFCGPGPDNTTWRYLTPVDSVDRTCMQHDQQYASCFSSLVEDTGVQQVPKIINQVMAARGVLVPAFVLRWAWHHAPRYMRCMHEADKKLVNQFAEILATEAYPSWWTNPALAPEGTQGVHGYKEACVLGAPWGGHCAVTTHRLSQIMLSMFRHSVNTDLAVAPHRALATTSAAARGNTNATGGGSSGSSIERSQPSLGLYFF